MTFFKLNFHENFLEAFKIIRLLKIRSAGKGRYLRSQIYQISWENHIFFQEHCNRKSKLKLIVEYFSIITEEMIRVALIF